MTKKAVIILSIIVAVIIIICAVIKFTYHPDNSLNAPSDNSQYPTPTLTIDGIDSGQIKINFRAYDDYFYNNKTGKWQFIYIKGVNMGLTEATTDLSNPNVSYDTYIDWFTKISQMNANTIRVFTVMPPQFYTALYDFNAAADKPIYLLQGIWFNENYMYDYDNAFDGNDEIITAFKRAITQTVDIIHGNSDYTDYGQIKNAEYKNDISQYLVGYILGLEWDYGFVQRTNQLKDKQGFIGDYLQTKENATAFETFLCEVGDYLIDYQTQKYSFQVPISFLNWATTDTITHTNEPFEEEDAVSVNTENIVSNTNYYCGLFAAIDVYPYYPEFLNYQPEYIKTDENGKINSYKSYLNDLNKQYSVPVLIAEFGLPTSRGKAHESIMGFDQGGLTEQQQGQFVSLMLKDIAKEGYAGSIIFSWQDEWFKQTWNTVKYTPDDASVRTPNVQSAEQGYGILAMEAGNRPTCAIDGNFDEWEKRDKYTLQDGSYISAMWDEAYLYLKIEALDFDFDKDKLFVPIQITGNGSTFSSEYNISFTEAVDFLLVINGQQQTRVLTDSYQDLFYYTYSYEKGIFDTNNKFEVKNSGIYNPINQYLSNEIILPLTGQVIEPKYLESGLLTYGINNPDSKDFNSLADFYFKDGCIEIRIPWYVLNVMNSTIGVCLDDFYLSGDINTQKFSSIKVGLARLDDKDIELYDIGYFTKSKSSFHTRLKKSYEIIKETLSGFMEFQK